MSKDGLCAIVTGSASGLGAATAAILAKGGARIVVNYSNSKSEAEATAELCRKAGAEVVVVQGDVSRDEDCKKIVAAAAPWGRLDVLDQQCRHHQACAARQTGRAFGGRFSAHLCREHDRAVPDDPRGARAAGGRRKGIRPAVGRGERVVGRRHLRRRLVGCLCREQGRAQHHDAIAGARAGAADPRQHGVPRLYRYALVHQGPWRGRRQGGARFRGGAGAAEGRVNSRRYRAAGVLPRFAGVEQHDRRIRAHGCGDASAFSRGSRLSIRLAALSDPAISTPYLQCDEDKRACHGSHGASSTFSPE